MGPFSLEVAEIVRRANERERQQARDARHYEALDIYGALLRAKDILAMAAASIHEGMGGKPLTIAAANEAAMGYFRSTSAPEIGVIYDAYYHVTRQLREAWRLQHGLPPKED